MLGPWASGRRHCWSSRAARRDSGLRPAPGRHGESGRRPWAWQGIGQLRPPQRDEGELGQLRPPEALRPPGVRRTRVVSVEKAAGSKARRRRKESCLRGAACSRPRPAQEVLACCRGPGEGRRAYSLPRGPPHRSSLSPRRADAGNDAAGHHRAQFRGARAASRDPECVTARAPRELLLSDPQTSGSAVGAPHRTARLHFLSRSADPFEEWDVPAAPRAGLRLRTGVCPDRDWHPGCLAPWRLHR